MRIRLLLALLFCVVSPTLLRGQQTGVGNSLSNANDSFFENIGTHWSARGNGWFFNGPGGAATPFGGIDANSGARGGVGFHGGGNF